MRKSQATILAVAVVTAGLFTGGATAHATRAAPAALSHPSYTAPATPDPHWPTVGPAPAPAAPVTAPKTLTPAATPPNKPAAPATVARSSVTPVEHAPTRNTAPTATKAPAAAGTVVFFDAGNGLCGETAAREIPAGETTYPTKAACLAAANPTTDPLVYFIASDPGATPYCGGTNQASLPAGTTTYATKDACLAAAAAQT